MYLNKVVGEQFPKRPCKLCSDETPLDFEIRMAFQPIVDFRDHSVFGYEALVRSDRGGGAAEVLARVSPEQLYRFDQTCRFKAIETASRLGLDSYLSINFLPRSVYEPAACIRFTLQAAERFGFPIERIIFETAESEDVKDEAHLARIFNHYKSRGFLTAIDDFGAGYAGLRLLADFQPDIIKADAVLVRGIHGNPPRQAIIRSLLTLCDEIGSTLLAEGVETIEEFATLHRLGVRLFQGYLFGRPQLEALSQVDDALWALARQAE